MNAATNGAMGESDSGVMIDDLVRVLGGLAETLRALIVGDGSGTHEAVVLHLGVPAPGDTCPGRSAPEAPPEPA